VIIAGKGYKTTVNIMAISRALDSELTECLKQLEEESKVDVVYIVDSFGALYQETTEFLIKKAKSILKSKEVGMHAHNNQQLAFGNTIEAIIHDANYVDGTVYGLGRAAGNCPLELILVLKILNSISAGPEHFQRTYLKPASLMNILKAMALRNSAKRITGNFTILWSGKWKNKMDVKNLSTAILGFCAA
jgi:isopropylmalate/homocitrate/citramalate synthase